MHPQSPSPAPAGPVRRLVVAAVAAASLITGLAACSADEPAAVDGGTIVVGLPSSPTGLDPNVYSGAVDALVMRQVFDSLVVELPDHTFGSWLASSWEISDDGLTYTFTLKEGVTFHDGTPFDAEAVKYNFDRILDPETQSRYAAPLLGTVTGAEVVDDSTVALTLSAPYQPLLEALSQPFLGMVSPTSVEENDGDVSFTPVGTGAFVFESYVTDQEIELTANEDYTSAPEGAAHEGAAYVDALTFEIVPETSARVGALQSGELTVANSIPAEQIDTLAADESLTVELVQVPGAAYSLYLNQDKAPWDDPAARQALRMGIDVDSIVETLYFGNYERAWSILSPATSSYASSVEDSWEYDPEGAIAAFEELGWTTNAAGLLEMDGQVLTVRMVDQSPNYDKRQDIDEIMQQQLAEIGVTLENSALEFPQYAAATQAGEYEMEGFSIQTGSPSVLWTIFDPANRPTAEVFSYNVAQVDDEEIVEWASSAVAALDAAEAEELYIKVQEKAIADAVAIPIYVGVSVTGISADLTGVTFDPRTYASYYDATFSG